MGVTLEATGGTRAVGHDHDDDNDNTYKYGRGNEEIRKTTTIISL